MILLFCYDKFLETEKMDIWSVVQAFLALVFVLGLMFVTLGAVKYLQLRGSGVWFKKLQSRERILIEERKKLDTKTALVLLRKDNTEFLLLTGAGGNLLLEKKEISDGKTKDEKGKDV